LQSLRPFMKSRVVFGKNSRRARGFSIVELLVVIAISLVVAGASFPLVGSISSKRSLDYKASEFVQFMRTARTRSIAGLNNGTHGIYLDTVSNPKQYVLYEVPAGVASPSYAARMSNLDIVIRLETGMSISSDISGNDVSFEKTTGKPLGFASSIKKITLTDAVGTSRIIEINELGIVWVQ